VAASRKYTALSIPESKASYSEVQSHPARQKVATVATAIKISHSLAKARRTSGFIWNSPFFL